ncbi:MAG: glycosyltransferase family 4 protein [Candidatus Magasanikbacteria bacterium]
MKILYLITKSEAGGAQTHVSDLCNYFAKQNEVVVMAGGDGWLKDECKKNNIKYFENKYFSNSSNPVRIVKAIKEIKNFVEKFKPDIVHCHSSSAAFLTRLAIRGKYKTIYTAHGWGFNIGMNPLVRFLVLLTEKINAGYTDKYICVSEFVKDLALKYKLAGEEKMTVIYNGITSTVDSRQSTVSSKVNLIFVGRLAEPKRPEMIIEVISNFEKEIQDKIQFTIVGDGPKRKYLEQLAKEKKVNVFFTGNLEHGEVMKELSKNDIFVFISAWEGFPYTILEALSVGLPVIASNVGGVGEIVDNTVGRLVENNAGKISQALLELINNPELRLKLGKNGMVLVEGKFSLESMLKKTEEVYQNILNS